MYASLVPQFPDPYPADPVRIVGLRHETALILMRTIDAREVRYRDGADAKYIVAADYTVTWIAQSGQETRLTVPRGMLTDLTSVPPVFRGLVNRVGPWLEAAIVHDFLTIAWRTLDGDGTAARRKFADDVMYAAMDAARIGFRKHLIYAAVRAAALVSYPRKVDPATQTALYVDLDDPGVQAQLPPGVHLPGSGGRRVVA